MYSQESTESKELKPDNGIIELRDKNGNILTVFSPHAKTPESLILELKNSLIGEK